MSCGIGHIHATQVRTIRHVIALLSIAVHAITYICLEFCAELSILDDIQPYGEAWWLTLPGNHLHMEERVKLAFEYNEISVCDSGRDDRGSLEDVA